MATYSLSRTKWSLNFDRRHLACSAHAGSHAGLVLICREADRTLICGDCVLKRITPNPIVSPDPIDPSKRFPSLGEYLVSLARMREYSPTLAYGGHGEPVTDFEEIFHRYVRRSTNVNGELCHSSRSRRDGFRDRAQTFSDVIRPRRHRFLAISEAIAHLDYAEKKGSSPSSKMPASGLPTTLRSSGLPVSAHIMSTVSIILDRLVKAGSCLIRSDTVRCAIHVRNPLNKSR